MANESAKRAIPASAPTSVPRDPEERKAWYEKMRAQMGKSRLAVDLKPAGRTCYWARKDDDHELSRLDMLGFQIVRDDPISPRYKANGLREDGTYVLGDVILMDIDTELYEFYLEENSERARWLVEGVPANFIKEQAERDVPAFRVEK